MVFRKLIKRGILPISVAGVIIILDQISKNWILDLLRENFFKNPITSFFNIVERWNKGVSFGMLGGQDLSPWFFIFFSVGVSLLLMIWAFREESALCRLALGCIVGGALSNSFDRFDYGAVFDFLEFHLEKYYWPAFNVADSAIVLGVVLLFLTTALKKRGYSEAKGNTHVL